MKTSRSTPGPTALPSWQEWRRQRVGRARKKPKATWPPPELTLPSLEVLEGLSRPEEKRAGADNQQADRGQAAVSVWGLSPAEAARIATGGRYGG